MFSGAHVASKSILKSRRTKQIAPVCDDIFGCHILVINIIFGGSNGYCFGMTMSISNTPPSYTVSNGPLIVPRKCRKSPSRTGFAITPEESSFDTSVNSFINRPLPDAIFIGYGTILVRYCCLCTRLFALFFEVSQKDNFVRVVVIYDRCRNLRRSGWVFGFRPSSRLMTHDRKVVR